MRMFFASTSGLTHRPGDLYLGVDPDDGREIGFRLSRHAFTIAGARAGKGACQIIPNLKRWPHAAIVIDPKGEAVKETAAWRRQNVGPVAVFDPFKVQPAGKPFWESFNPLDLMSASYHLDALVDGLVMQDPRSQEHWTEGPREVCGGLIHFLANAPQCEGNRTLPRLRQLLSALQRPETKDGGGAREYLLDAMYDLGGLAEDAANRITGGTTENRNLIDGISTQTKWLRNEDIAAVLAHSSVDLNRLRGGKLTVYLVLPPGALASYGRFLRLFVRMALSVMEHGGSEETPCLFILDEFHALGYMEEIEKSAGLMPGYGVHLWPILQNLGQLERLYGRSGMSILLGEAEATSVFGIDGTDTFTPRYISEWTDRVSPHDIAMNLREIYDERADAARVTPPLSPQNPLHPQITHLPPATPRPDGRVSSGDMFAQFLVGLGNAAERERYEREAAAERDRYARDQAAFSNARAREARLAGEERILHAELHQPRMTPGEIKSYTRKEDGAKVARRMLVNLRGNRWLSLIPQPYFAPPRPVRTLPPPEAAPARTAARAAPQTIEATPAPQPRPAPRAAAKSTPNNAGRYIAYGLGALFVFAVIDHVSRDPPAPTPPPPAIEPQPEFRHTTPRQLQTSIERGYIILTSEAIEAICMPPRIEFGGTRRAHLMTVKRLRSAADGTAPTLPGVHPRKIARVECHGGLMGNTAWYQRIE